MQNVTGKTAFITGGASGIGLGDRQGVAGCGDECCDRRYSRRSSGRSAAPNWVAATRVLAVKLDVTDRADFARAADAAEAKFGKIHILCNNAGVAVVGPTELATYSDWDWVMNVNVGGAINGVTTMLPRILAHGEGGHIVNTCSMSGHRAGGWHDDLFDRQGSACDDDGMYAPRTRRARGDLFGILPRRCAIEHCRGRQNAARRISGLGLCRSRQKTAGWRQSVSSVPDEGRSWRARAARHFTGRALYPDAQRISGRCK